MNNTDSDIDSDTDIGTGPEAPPEWLNPKGLSQDLLGRSLSYFLRSDAHWNNKDADPELQLLQDDLIVIAVNNILCAIVRYPDTASLPHFDPQAYAAGLKQLSKGLLQSQRSIEILLLGGDDQAWKDLRAGRPLISLSSLSQYQLDNENNLHSKLATARKHPLQGLVQELQKQRSEPQTATEPLDPAAFKQVQKRIEQAQEQHAKTLGELQNFQSEYRQRKPWLTWSLAAIIAIVYVLQMLWGGSDKTPVLLRMGAMSAQGLAHGEWWRLWSASFLHGSIMHVGFNLYVLVILGDLIERILGRWRLLLLYVASVGAGGLGSWAYLSLNSGGIGLSVGASGGLWGLLGAHAILAFRQKHLLPSWLHARAQKAALINLGINILVSFQPHVDFAAHLGGGLMGSLLMFSGLLTTAVKPLSNGDAQAAEKDSEWTLKQQKSGSRLLPLISLLSGVLLFSALLIALVHGQAWQLGQNPRYVQTSVSTAMGSLRLPIPSALQRQNPEQMSQVMAQQTSASSTNGSTSGSTNGSTRGAEKPAHNEQLFGDLRKDPAMIAIASGLMGPVLAVPEAEADNLLLSLQTLPPGTQFIESPQREKRPNGDQQIRVRYRYANGLQLHQIFHLSQRFWWRIDVLSWPDFWNGRLILQKVSASLTTEFEQAQGIQ